MPSNTKPPPERYEVDPVTGCWNWTGFVNDEGYGQLSVKCTGRITTRKAHAIVYESKNGAVPNGKKLDHLCRNRRCVNPDHLEVVSNAENVRRGLSAKLDIETVGMIRRRYSVENISQATLATEYGVSERTIHFVVRAQSWTADLEPVSEIRKPVGRRSILSRDQISDIQRRAASGEKKVQLAREFGVSPALVTRFTKETTGV